MIVTTEEGYQIDLTKGIDCSIPLSGDAHNLTAWHVPSPHFDPVKDENWTGLVEEGGSVNFRNIYFNPHGHGTHTECLGHITPEIYSINEHIKTFFFRAVLISIFPEKIGGDEIITEDQLKEKLVGYSSVEAVIIRTLPNDSTKMNRQYSATNPPYLEREGVGVLNKLKIKHLLVDLPSVDQEDDGGKTAFHHAFFGVPNHLHFDRTITELIFVPPTAKDGDYLLNLQFAPFENDAAPSRPVLFELKK